MKQTQTDKVTVETNPFRRGVEMTVPRYYAHCRSCKWYSKECGTKSEAAEKYNNHARKHMAIESVEREVPCRGI